MDSCKGSFCRSLGSDHGPGAPGAPGDVRRQTRRYSSRCCEDSTRRRESGGIYSFSLTLTKQINFDYDKLATALTRGRPTAERKLPKLLDDQVKDIRTFLDFVANVEDMPD